MAKKKRTRNNGRRYESSEWVEFILDGVAESEEAEDVDVEITPALAKEVERYKEAVDNAVESCSRSFPPAEDIVVGDEEYLDIYHTLTGAGVGIWDGRWDHYYPTADWEALSNCYEAKLGKFADSTGGGSLEDAMREAVYEAKEGNPGIPPSATETRKLKNKLLR